MIRTLSLIGALSGLATIASAEYSVTFLNPLPGDFALVVKDVSDDGQWFAGISYELGAGGRGVRWKLGEQPSFLDFAYVDGINNSGTVAGAVAQPFPLSGNNQAAIWLADGTKILYPMATVGTSTFSRALGINNNGLVVGHAPRPLSSFGHAISNVFFPDSSTINDLGILPGDAFQGLQRVNDNNWAIGNGSQNGSTPSGFIYRPGTGLSYLSSAIVGGYTSASDINNNNYVAGIAVGGSNNAVVWNPDGSMKTLGGIFGGAKSINNLNQVVGSGIVNNKEKALLWNDFDSNIVLQDFLPEIYRTTWDLRTADFISDNGNIVATMLDPNGTYYTVLLTPQAVPEPFSAIGIIGITSLLIKRKKTRPKK
ncbi:MAG: hypothetical protein KF824_08590 [Fimbriimonadaceae bacterium]|nr:MAG: hypothetical protein KF824_08590 [Fimbriimonadaceae bacterium]